MDKRFEDESGEVGRLQRYGLELWGEDNFVVKNGLLSLNYKSSPTLLEIVSKIRDSGLKGPILLRFPHLIKKQVATLFDSFKRAKQELSYSGSFQALFPLKVNQSPSLIQELNYGLEAGSKAELLIAILHTKDNSPITLNGFKDRELITLGFLSAKMGQNITITIEGINELETIIEYSKTQDITPNIGIRIKLHSTVNGLWEKSGGIDSKFGLSATELISAIKLLKENSLIDKLTMIHFHIGSQITTIMPLKKAIKEAGNIFADLIKMGALSLDTINLGGGLAVEYSQNINQRSLNYSLDEYANNILFTLQSIAKQKGVQEPNILIESGRYIAASHALLIAPVYEQFSQEYKEELLELKEINPPLVDELKELHECMDETNALEFLHDSLEHLNSLHTLFDLGYIDLVDRSNSEILTNLIIKKSIKLLDSFSDNDLLAVQQSIQEKYLVNFSLFQSMPDFWGLRQHFPIMPISDLDKKPTRSATIWDITCDSDGEISFDKNNPLYLHDLDLKDKDYFLGFFLVGAYQEVLGMRHNLFEKPTEVTIEIDDHSYDITNIIDSPTIDDTLKSLGYDTSILKDEFGELLNENSYLRTFLNE
jgi:arginine decarboxylase